MSVRLGAARVRTFVTGAALLSTTMLLVSAANYALNFALARLLPPAQFGDATLAITLVLAAAVVAATVQLVAARSGAAHPESVPALRRILVRTAAIAGLAAAVLMIAGSWFLADVLQTSTPWMFAIIGAGLPVYFVQAVHRGLLQGALRFGRLALSYAAEAVARVVVVIALVWAGYGVIGAAIGILVSFLASAAVARTRSGRHAHERAVDRSALRVTALAAVTMVLAQMLLNNADLVLAKAAFDPGTAGVYAAAAVLCRSLYFVSWSVVQAAVPVLASATSTGGDRRRAFAVAVGVIAGLGAVATLAVSVWGEILVDLLFGAAYTSAAPLLLPYVISTSLLSAATLLAAVDVARGSSTGPVLLLAGAFVQVAALAVAGDTPATMAWLQVATTALTLGALAVAAVSRARRTTPRPNASAATAAAASTPAAADVTDTAVTHTAVTTAITEEQRSS